MKFELHSDFVTTPEYWDCECTDNYIHDKSTTSVCPYCEAEQENQPDSRLDEVADYFKSYYRGNTL